MNNHLFIFSGLQILFLTAAIPAGADQPSAVAGIMRDVTELGDILQKKHAVFDPGATTNITATIIKAIDPYAEVLTKEQAERRAEELRGVFYDVGLSLAIKNKMPTVSEVTGKGPAETAGIKAGNVIERINDQKTEGLSLETVVARLRGAKDESVRLTIRAGDKNSETNECVLKRAVFHMPIAGVTEEWPYKMCFMKVNGLYDNSGVQIVSQLVAWAETNCSGIIIDLRNADGGDLQAAADIAGIFLPGKAPVINLLDGNGSTVSSYTGKTGKSIEAPLMVLINHDTSNAAEALAATLSAGKSVLLIGTPTRGDDCQREFVPLSDGRIIYLATRRIETNRGVSYHGTGISPHIAVMQVGSPAVKVEEPAGEEDNGLFTKLSDEEKLNRALLRRTKGDAVLQRATDILLGLKALNIKGR
jgi:carboxyl-terminal processing protease